MEVSIDARYVRERIRLNKDSVVRAETGPSGSVGITTIPSRTYTILSFIGTDVLALLSAAFFSFAIAEFLWTGMADRHILIALPVFAIQGLVFAAMGLYTNTAMHPAEEMRRVSLFTTVIYLIYVAAYLGGHHQWAMVGLLVTMWGSSVFLTITGRVFLRIFCAPASWWGYPVVIIGEGEMGGVVIRTMKRWPELGFKPVVLLDSTASVDEIEGVPVRRDYGFAPRLSREWKIPCAVIAMSKLPSRKRHALLSRYAKFFDRLLVVPETCGTDFLWTTSVFFKGMLGYDVRYNYHKHLSRLSKRTVDVVGAIIGILLLAPLWITLMILIKFDSVGPVFYRQLRMGEKGRVFSVLKFRSMHTDADRQLAHLLERAPEMREEYDEYHKLRDDPRVTRIGHVLRRLSLDELPQLWNVLCGHMSLVGPRAYTLNELAVMYQMESVIIQSRPGLTGLWQVSGRNQLSFDERVNLDVHYIHNWNFWLDVYILARTFPVVLKGEGAC